MDLIIRAVVVYVFAFVALRSLGKRELGQLTPFELVLLFVIGDLIQQAITQNDTSITGAVLVISTLVLLILAESYVVFRWKPPRKLLESMPVVLVRHGEVLATALHRERMNEEEVRQSARAQGIADLATVTVAILETDGSISFVTDGAQRRRTDNHETAT